MPLGIQGTGFADRNLRQPNPQYNTPFWETYGRPLTIQEIYAFPPRGAYYLRTARNMPWAEIARRLNLSGESIARAMATRFARENNFAPLTVPNPRRSAAARVAVAARFNRPIVAQSVRQQVLNPQPTGLRTFGCEIEYVNMNRVTVANAVAVALGVPHIHVFPYHGDTCETCQVRVTEKYREWKVERDGSVSSGGEVVSPILSGEDGFQQIKKVATAVRQAGGRINTNCGLHIHLGMRDLTKAQRAKLIQRWYANSVVVNQFVSRSRWGNRYCQQASAREINYWVNQLTNENTDPDGIKMRSLNIAPFKKIGTYEFRLHQGSLSPKKIVTWIKFLLAFTEFATMDEEIQNPTDGTQGLLDYLVQPLAAKVNLFTERDAQFMQERVRDLTTGRRN